MHERTALRSCTSRNQVGQLMVRGSGEVAASKLEPAPGHWCAGNKQPAHSAAAIRYFDVFGISIFETRIVSPFSSPVRFKNHNLHGCSIPKTVTMICARVALPQRQFGS